MECPRCGVHFVNDGLTSIEPAVCTSCGFLLHSNQETPPIARYIVDLKAILFHPQAFFKQLPLDGSWTQPLTFALVTHWISTALKACLPGASRNFFSDLIVSPSFFFQWNMIPDGTLHWFSQTGSILLDPFFTLIALFFSSCIIFIGVRLFVAQRTSYVSTFRIVCYCMASSIFLILPYVGPIITALFGFFLTLIGLQKVFRITLLRALTIVLFPKIIIPGIIALGGLYFFFSLLKWFLGSFFFSF